jgi:hypothetical protein
MAFPQRLKDLCPPALFYFIISMIAIFILLLQNIGGSHTRYHVANFSCIVPSTIIIFILKIIYILFWTWVLNLICKDGYKMISWLLVFAPFLLFLIVLGLILINK